MSKAEQRALEKYPYEEICREKYIEGYHQAEKDVAEAFARIIRGNLGGIENGIKSMFEQLYTDITGGKIYKGFKD